MIFDLQKASMWKRISAWLFDMILLGILVAGIAFTLSSLTNYDSYSRTLDEAYTRYESQYHTSFTISEEEYNRLPADSQQAYLDGYHALTEDPQAMHAYSMMLSLSLTITSLSILAGFLISEFAVPMCFGNGQTLGKKIFAIGVMRTDGVRLSTVQLFIRTVLGKFTIETMIPVLVVMMIFFGFAGIGGTLLVLALGLLQIILLLATRTNAPIHDCLAGTVVIDLQSQMIFDSQQALTEAKKKAAADAAARQSY